MSTLFQLHAPMNTLKSMVREMAPLWHAGDSILLLGETVASLPWLKMYIEDINHDEESVSHISDIAAIYVLEEDFTQLNDTAKSHIDLSKIEVLNDLQWVELTQSIDRVITLNSLS